MKSLRIACLQVQAGSNVESNLTRLRSLMRRAMHKSPDMIALPETFYWRGSNKNLFSVANNYTAQVLKEFQSFAKEKRCAILLGSVLEPIRRSRKVYNTSVLINAQGRILGRYRKIHLFDIFSKKLRLQESKNVRAGSTIKTLRACGTTLGLSICYDLRFPELFRKLTKKGARVIFVPANFTYVTGVAHWESLLRTRAIENQVYIVAPAQSGTHPTTKVRTYGNSMVIDPWGRIMARGKTQGEAILTAKLDFQYQNKIRQDMPVLSHCRLI